MARKIRARDILRMAAGGLSGWAIADALGVSCNSASATLAAAEHEGISWGRGADGRLRGLRAAASRKGGGDPAPVGRPCGGLHAVLRHGGSPRDRASRYPGLKQAQDSPRLRSPRHVAPPSSRTHGEGSRSGTVPRRNIDGAERRYRAPGQTVPDIAISDVLKHAITHFQKWVYSMGQRCSVSCGSIFSRLFIAWAGVSRVWPWG